MIIVDDRMSIDALAGVSVGVGAEAVATTWCFHFRLVRALSDPARFGSLSAAAGEGVLRAAVDPPSERLIVLDPRAVTATAAALAVKYGLNLLAAELFASASKHGAEVRLSEPNVGRGWIDVMRAERIRFEIA